MATFRSLLGETATIWNGVSGFDTAINAITPTANRTISFPDASGTVALTSNIPVVPAVTAGSFAFVPTVSLTGDAAPTFLLNQANYTKVGIATSAGNSIYTCSISGTITSAGSADTAGVVKMAVAISTLPGGAGIAGGSLIAVGAGGSFRFDTTNPVLFDGITNSMQWDNPNAIWTVGWTGDDGWTIGDSFPLGWTFQYFSGA